MTSPYERALDLTGLDPALEAYFSEIPTGSIGVGSGIFDRVGTPRWWLWPLLAVLGADGILAPTWQRDVAFTVINRPQPDGTLVAERRFALRGRAFTMVDRMTERNGCLTDVLGRSARLEAAFRGQIEGGELHLTSTAVRVRLGRRWVRLPRRLSPRVRLVERSNPGGPQHVAVVLELPGIGRLYEYSGEFSYAIQSSSTAHNPGERSS